MKSIIILNGEINNYNIIKSYIEKDDYIIACDGAIRHCELLEVTPNIIIGDFDSADIALLDKYRGVVEVLQYPVDKDYTDGELGIQKAVEVNNKDVVIIGGFSYNGRIEHALANIFMMKALNDSNLCCKMVSETSEVYYVTDEIDVNITKKYISILPISDILEIEKSKGLKYDLTGEVFYFGSSRSLSNEYLDETLDNSSENKNQEKNIYIKIKKGRALVIMSCD